MKRRSAKGTIVATWILGLFALAGLAAPSGASPSKIYFTEMTAWTPAPGGPAHVYSANPDGSGKVQLTTTPGCRIDDVELDSTNGHVYYTNWCSGGGTASAAEGIWRMNTDGSGAVQVVGDAQNNSGNGHASGMHAVSIDEASGQLFWARHVSYASPAEISKMNLDGTGYTVLDTQGWFVTGVDFDPVAGHVYWGNHGIRGPGDLNRVNLDGSGATSLLPRTADEGTGVAIDVAAGVVFYGRWRNFNPAADGRVTRYDIATGTTTVIFDDPTTGVTDLEVDPVDQRVWFVSHATGEIRSMDYDGSNMVTEVSGLSLPYGLDLELAPPLPGGCTVSPLTGCMQAARSIVNMRNDASKPDTTDKFLWRFKRAMGPIDLAADFGDPVNNPELYGVCIYESSGGSPVFYSALEIDGLEVCGSAPCWSAKPNGAKMRYRRSDTNHMGVSKLILRGGATGAGFVVKGRGAAMSLPGPTLPNQHLMADTEVLVQLRSSVGACFESRFTPTEIRTNNATRFKATSQQ